MKTPWVLMLALAAAGCSKKRDDKPAPEPSPSRQVPGRDFHPGPVVGDGEKPDRVQPPPRMDRRAEFDTDGDGQLSDEERDTMKETRRAERDERRQEMMKQFDKDGDGQLSDDERKAMRVERLQGMVGRLDADGDGKLSQAEFESGPAGRRRGPPIDFATADTDHDGALTADELAAALPDRGPGGFRRDRGEPEDAE